MTKQQIINRIKNELAEVREYENLEAFLEARKTWISSSEYFTRIWHLAQEGIAPILATELNLGALAELEAEGTILITDGPLRKGMRWVRIKE